MPSSPLLMTKGLRCADVPMINVPETASDVELTIHNELADVQAVHLHGLRFQVMSLMDEHASGPVLRDTVPVPPSGSVVIRIIADNPGMWMLQAMATNAMERGAATVLNVLPSPQPEIPGW